MKCMTVILTTVLWVGPSLAWAEKAIPQPASPSAPPSAAVKPDKTDKPADKPADTPPAAPKVDPQVLRVYLTDGSIVAGKINLKDIVVETSYGTLKIPIGEVRAFTPGLDSHPETASNLAALIDKLGSAEFNERENAQKELTKMGPSIRMELSKFKQDPDAERRNRVQAVLDEFEGMADDGDDAPAPAAAERADKLETKQFTVTGRIMPREFEVVSAYGSLKVKLSDIQSVKREAVGAREEAVKTVTVQGQDIANISFRSTNIRVEKGDQVTITADGNVNLSPWGSRAMSTPDGMTNYGMFQPGQIPMGALVMKIGKDGPLVKVGSKNTLTADRSGTLSFGVAIQADYAGNQFPGQYNVKVRIKPKG